MSIRKIINKPLTPIIKSQFLKTDFVLIKYGVIIIVRAKTRAILEIFDPITFPIDISGWFERTASTLITSSGADVAKETIVTATTREDNLRWDASETLPLTRYTPLNNSRARPANNFKYISIEGL